MFSRRKGDGSSPVKRVLSVVSSGVVAGLLLSMAAVSPANAEEVTKSQFEKRFASEMEPFLDSIEGRTQVQRIRSPWVTSVVKVNPDDTFRGTLMGQKTKCVSEDECWFYDTSVERWRELPEGAVFVIREAPVASDILDLDNANMVGNDPLTSRVYDISDGVYSVEETYESGAVAAYTMKVSKNRFALKVTVTAGDSSEPAFVSSMVTKLRKKPVKVKPPKNSRVGEPGTMVNRVTVNVY